MTQAAQCCAGSKRGHCGSGVRVKGRPVQSEIKHDETGLCLRGNDWRKIDSVGGSDVEKACSDYRTAIEC